MSPSADPRIGRELLGYRIEARLGRGGMGIVYRAEHLRLKRKVALKLLAPELAEDEPFRERFLRESELAASLDHPHIVPIYDAGEIEGQLYIAMRYVAGSDLKTLLREQGRLEPRRTLALLAQVADALDAAHEAGLVHRDVKPGNVLLDSREHCYLADFGLTKQVSSQSGFTATGQIAGTTEYVAPEVIEGKTLDARADIYSLGCVLYECLAGEPPFHRDSEFAVLWAHVNQPAPRLSEHAVDLPRELDAVLFKALAKRPEQRQQTGGELVQAARLAFPVTTLPPPRSRRRRRVVLGALVLVAAAAAIAVPLGLTRGSDGASSKPTIAVKNDAVQRIDPRTNKLVATITAPVDLGLLAAGGGSVWAANSDQNRLFRIDPSRNVVTQTIQTVDPRGLSVGAGSLWVLDASDGVVTRFDAETGAATAALPLPPGTPSFRVAVVRASSAAVWVQWAGRAGNAVWINPESTAVKAVNIGTRSVPVIDDFAMFGPILWARAIDPRDPTVNAILRIDLRKPAWSAPTVIPIGLSYGYLAADRSGVWLTTVASDRVDHVSAKTLRVDRHVAVADEPLAIAAGEGAVWVASRTAGIVSRIDPKTGKVVATIAVGPNPGTIAVGSGGVWTDVHPLSS